MPSTELDLPVLASAEQIRRRQFVTVRRGYDPEQVRDYLERVAAHVEQMEAMMREARLEAEAATQTASSPKTDPYEQLGARVAGVIRAADEEAERIRRETRQETERILREARADADRIALDAQSRAEEAKAESERVLREAREHADRDISGLAARREGLVEQLSAMQQRLLAVARDLEAAIEPGSDSVVETLPEVPAQSLSGAESELGRDAGVLEPERDEVLRPGVDSPREELWGGTETIDLSIPDIPPLDLDWGDEEDEDADRDE
jgi:cell division initiation protein